MKARWWRITRASLRSRFMRDLRRRDLVGGKEEVLKTNSENVQFAFMRCGVFNATHYMRFALKRAKIETVTKTCENWATSWVCPTQPPHPFTARKRSWRRGVRLSFRLQQESHRGRPFIAVRSSSQKWANMSFNQACLIAGLFTVMGTAVEQHHAMRL